MVDSPVMMVTVYSFRTYDTQERGYVVMPFKARQDDIISRWDGQLLQGTAEEVDAKSLDEQGRFRRRATGWGDLG